MSFAAPLFLWYFLPTVLFLHWILPVHWRNGILAVSSLLFYAVGGGEFVLILIAMMVINYLAGLAIAAVRESPPRRTWITPKSVLTATVVADLAVLAIWKYAGFASTVVHQIASRLGLDTQIVSVALPVGISFFTFHHLSYVVDVYRGTRAPMKNPLTFATYIAMFPQLVAGPIIRYHEIVADLERRSHPRLADFADGFPRFLWGLFKKVAIADSLAPLADAAFAADNPSFATAWLGAIAYTGQIYFDFSGYSDMAIGLGRMFGLRIPENFNRPYSAVSVTDFWRRWHMSLSRWFRDYLYIPLGGNRHGTFNTYRNLSIVFFATGLWHGAAWTFILWGIYHGLWMIFERATGLADAKTLVPLRRFATFVIVIFGWVLFRAESLGEFGRMLRAMLTPGALGEPNFGIEADIVLLMGPVHVALLALVLVSAFFPGTWTVGRILDHTEEAPTRRQISARLAVLVVAPVAAALVVGSTFSPFLYFQF